MSFDPQPLPNKIVIPSDLHAARQVEETVIRAVEQRGFSAQCGFAIRLALEEAIVNAHKHGNQGDSTKQITVTYDIRPDQAVVRIRDDGNGFNPDGVPDPTAPDRLSLPHGRGLMLMRAYVDEVTFNETGNEVQLVKERS